MPLNRRAIISALALAAVLLPPAGARAQEAPNAAPSEAPNAAPSAAPSVNAQCAQAYEQGQVQRKSGGLLQARITLQQCAQDQCPDFIRNDCLGWFAEVQNDVPTLVFAAKSQGRDLSDVSVSLGSRVLASRIDGQLLELDPGAYDLRFQSPGMQTQTKHFVLVPGERNRLIEVELVPVGAATEQAVPPPLPPRPRSLLLPGIFAGVGAVGLGGFAGLGAWGRSNESKLERSCSPNCRKGDVSDVKTKYLLADVSLGVGVASLALGAYFFFRQDSGDAPAVGVSATTRTATLTYGGAF
jgi:hypothetical protein